MPAPRSATVVKRVLDPTRVRRVPSSFSWIDRRFLRHGWIERLARDEILLYLFLVAVGDRQGLSYYSDQRIARTLKIDREQIVRARDELVRHGLLAYETPLYQILSLTPPPTPPRREVPVSLAEVFRAIADRPHA